MYLRIHIPETGVMLSTGFVMFEFRFPSPLSPPHSLEPPHGCSLGGFCFLFSFRLERNSLQAEPRDAVFFSPSYRSVLAGIRNPGPLPPCLSLSPRLLVSKPVSPHEPDHCPPPCTFLSSVKFAEKGNDCSGRSPPLSPSSCPPPAKGADEGPRAGLCVWFFHFGSPFFSRPNTRVA